MRTVTAAPAEAAVPFADGDRGRHPPGRPVPAWEHREAVQPASLVPGTRHAVSPDSRAARRVLHTLRRPGGPRRTAPGRTGHVLHHASLRRLPWSPGSAQPGRPGGDGGARDRVLAALRTKADARRIRCGASTCIMTNVSQFADQS